MAEVEDKKATNGTLAGPIAELAEATQDTVAYSRKRFLWTWLVLGLLAFFIGLSLFLGIRNAQDQADLAKAKAASAKQQSDDIVGFLKGDNGLPGVPGPRVKGTQATRVRRANRASGRRPGRRAPRATRATRAIPGRRTRRSRRGAGVSGRQR